MYTPGSSLHIPPEVSALYPDLTSAPSNASTGGAFSRLLYCDVVHQQLAGTSKAMAVFVAVNGLFIGKINKKQIVRQVELFHIDKMVTNICPSITSSPVAARAASPTAAHDDMEDTLDQRFVLSRSNLQMDEHEPAETLITALKENRKDKLQRAASVRFGRGGNSPAVAVAEAGGLAIVPPEVAMLPIAPQKYYIFLGLHETFEDFDLLLVGPRCKQLLAVLEQLMAHRLQRSLLVLLREPHATTYQRSQYHMRLSQSSRVVAPLGTHCIGFDAELFGNYLGLHAPGSQSPPTGANQTALLQGATQLQNVSFFAIQSLLEGPDNAGPSMLGSFWAPPPSQQPSAEQRKDLYEAPTLENSQKLDQPTLQKDWRRSLETFKAALRQGKSGSSPAKGAKSSFAGLNRSSSGGGHVRSSHPSTSAGVRTRRSGSFSSSLGGGGEKGPNSPLTAATSKAPHPTVFGGQPHHSAPSHSHSPVGAATVAASNSSISAVTGASMAHRSPNSHSAPAGVLPTVDRVLGIPYVSFPHSAHSAFPVAAQTDRALYFVARGYTCLPYLSQDQQHANKERALVGQLPGNDKLQEFLNTEFLFPFSPGFCYLTRNRLYCAETESSVMRCAPLVDLTSIYFLSTPIEGLPTPLFIEPYAQQSIDPKQSPPKAGATSFSSRVTGIIFRFADTPVGREPDLYVVLRATDAAALRRALERLLLFVNPVAHGNLYCCCSLREVLAAERIQRGRGNRRIALEIPFGYQPHVVAVPRRPLSVPHYSASLQTEEDDHDLSGLSRAMVTDMLRRDIFGATRPPLATMALIADQARRSAEADSVLRRHQQSYPQEQSNHPDRFSPQSPRVKAIMQAAESAFAAKELPAASTPSLTASGKNLAWMDAARDGAASVPLEYRLGCTALRDATLLWGDKALHYPQLSLPFAISHPNVPRPTGVLFEPAVFFVTPTQLVLYAAITTAPAPTSAAALPIMPVVSPLPNVSYELRRVLDLDAIEAVLTKRTPALSRPSMLLVLFQTRDPTKHLPICISVHYDEHKPVHSCLHQIQRALQLRDPLNLPSFSSYVKGQLDAYAVKAAQAQKSGTPQDPALEVPKPTIAAANFRQRVRLEVHRIVSLADLNAVGSADRLVDVYHGRELELLDMLYNAYPNVQRQPLSDTSLERRRSAAAEGYRKRIRHYCEHYTPESMAVMDGVLCSFEGHEDALLKYLVDHFGPEPGSGKNTKPPAAPKPAAGSSSAGKTRGK